MKEVIEVKRDDLRELYQVLTNSRLFQKNRFRTKCTKFSGKIHSSPKTSQNV